MRLTGKVISAERDNNVDQIPEPPSHDIFRGFRGDDLDELRLEELVSVKENIVTEPSTSRCQYTRTEVVEGHLE